MASGWAGLSQCRPKRPEKRLVLDFSEEKLFPLPPSHVKKNTSLGVAFYWCDGKPALGWSQCFWWVAGWKDKECWAVEVTNPKAGPNLKSSVIWENTFPLFLPAWGRVSVISNGNHPHRYILHIQPISKSSLFFFLNISKSTHLSPSPLLIMISFRHHAGLIWVTAKPPISSIPWFVGIGLKTK